MTATGLPAAAMTIHVIAASGTEASIRLLFSESNSAAEIRFLVRQVAEAAAADIQSPPFPA